MKGSLIVGSLVTFISAILAQEETEEPVMRQRKYYSNYIHPLTNMPDSALDVVTSYVFPKHPDHKLPIGENVIVLCHFSNAGNYPYNLTAMMGSLNSPFDFSFHIQNYSYQQVGVVVPPNEEVTLKYEFMLHPDLQPVDYFMAHTVFYEDDNMAYSSTFFNQTIQLYYPDTTVDYKGLWMLACSIFSTLFVLALAVYGCTEQKPAAKAKKTRHTKASSDDDWLEETNKKHD